ncbi:MAG: thioredoxin family protein [Alphaproteobacteria bacterium]
MMKINVLGTGCPKCKTLLENVTKATEELGLDCEIKKVTDINEIISFGVMSVPTLVVNDKIVVSGKAASVNELKQILGEVQ